MSRVQNYVAQQLNKQKGSAATGRASSSNNVTTTSVGVDVAVHLQRSTVFFRHFDLNETTTGKLIINSSFIFF